MSVVCPGFVADEEGGGGDVGNVDRTGRSPDNMAGVHVMGDSG